MGKNIKAIVRSKQSWILINRAGFISCLLEDRNQMITIPPCADGLVACCATSLVFGAPFRSIIESFQSARRLALR